MALAGEIIKHLKSTQTDGIKQAHIVWRDSREIL